jgi:putative ABC transport system substrate-binding protein
MRRRDFISGFAASATAWPFAARAQQTMPVVGFLSSGSLAARSPLLPFFSRGMSDIGYIEGRNVAVEYRWAQGRNDQLPSMAADLVRRRVSAIAAFGYPPVLAAKAASATMPIVFLLATDPVKAGFVASLSHPGGNLTGVSTLAVEIVPKRLELLRALFPTATSAAILVNPTNVGNAETTLTEVREAARVLSFQLQVVGASTDEQIEAAFAKFVQLRPSGLVIGTDGFFISRAERIAALALQHKVPTIFHYRPFVTAGGLISYGTRLSDVYYHIGNYIGRILKGDKPAQLPVQQPTAVELIINLRTAKALGIDIPLSLTGRADEVIE